MDPKFGASWDANFSTLRDFPVCVLDGVLFSGNFKINFNQCALCSVVWETTGKRKAEGSFSLPGKSQDRESHFSDTSLLCPDCKKDGRI
jgi:hypothetical protein